eukprot:442397-Pelagomonas_calceolata.AAC.1
MKENAGTRALPTSTASPAHRKSTQKVPKKPAWLQGTIYGQKKNVARVTEDGKQLHFGAGDQLSRVLFRLHCEMREE